MNFNILLSKIGLKSSKSSIARVQATAKGDKTFASLMEQEWFILPEGEELEYYDQATHNARNSLINKDNNLKELCAVCGKNYRDKTSSFIINVLPKKTEDSGSDISIISICRHCRMTHKMPELLAMAKQGKISNKISVKSASQQAVEDGQAVNLLIGFCENNCGFTITSGTFNDGFSVAKPSPQNIIGLGVSILFADTTLKSQNKNDYAGLLQSCMSLQDTLAEMPIPNGDQARDIVAQQLSDFAGNNFSCNDNSKMTINFVSGVQCTA